MSTQGLIFDCDGTLADTMPVHWLVWDEIARAHGLQLTRQRFYALAGVSTRGIIERLCKEQRVELDIDAVAIARDEAFYRRTEEIERIDLVVEIAREHRGRTRMAVASGGTTRQVRTVLEAIDVLDWFHAIVSADDVAHPKPAPDIFLEAARRLGVPPQSCTVYEDADLGVEAGRAAGMQVVDIRPLLGSSSLIQSADVS